MLFGFLLWLILYFYHNGKPLPPLLFLSPFFLRPFPKEKIAFVFAGTLPLLMAQFFYLPFEFLHYSDARSESLHGRGDFSSAFHFHQVGENVLTILEQLLGYHGFRTVIADHTQRPNVVLYPIYLVPFFSAG